MSNNSTNMLLQCLKKGLFTRSAISLETQKSLLIKIRDPKINFGYCTFLMSLMNIFSYMCPRFLPKSVSSSHHRTNTDNVGVSSSPNQISWKWVPNPGQEWREMQICHSQIFQRQHAQHWLLFKCPIKFPNLISER